MSFDTTLTNPLDMLKEAREGVPEPADAGIRYSGKPGQHIRTMNGAEYTVAPSGAFVRTNKVKLNKKERRKYRAALKERQR